MHFQGKRWCFLLSIFHQLAFSDKFYWNFWLQYFLKKTTENSIEFTPEESMIFTAATIIRMVDYLLSGKYPTKSKAQNKIIAPSLWHSTPQ